MDSVLEVPTKLRLQACEQFVRERGGQSVYVVEVDDDARQAPENVQDLRA